MPITRVLRSEGIAPHTGTPWYVAGVRKDGRFRPHAVGTDLRWVERVARTLDRDGAEVELRGP